MAGADEVSEARKTGADVGLRLAMEMQDIFGPEAAEAVHGTIEGLVVALATWTSSQEAFETVYATIRAAQLADRYPVEMSADEARACARGLICETVADLPEPMRRQMVATVEGLLQGCFGALSVVATSRHASAYAVRLAKVGVKLGERGHRA